MPSASVVRVLDKGMLADQHGQGMEFIVLERAEVSVKDYLDASANIRERRFRICQVSERFFVVVVFVFVCSLSVVVFQIALQMLKGVADLHVLGRRRFAAMHLRREFCGAVLRRAQFFGRNQIYAVENR